MQLKKRHSNAIVRWTHRSPVIKNASWYEILLFKTRLQFLNPKATFKLPANLDGKQIDKRPFINTLSRETYYTGDDAGRYLQSIYSTAWGYYSMRLFSKPLATLKLELSCIAVIDSDIKSYPDLNEPAVGIEWLKSSFNRLQVFMNEISFTQLDNGSMRADLRSTEIAQAMANQMNLQPEQITIASQVAYKAQTFSNQVEFYIPFTSADMLQFSFTLLISPAASETQKMELKQHADEYIKQIINSVILEYPNKRLSGFRGKVKSI